MYSTCKLDGSPNRPSVRLANEQAKNKEIETAVT